MKVDGALVASLTLLAVALRLVPLTFSPLPYNIDGFPLARIADDMAASGSWTIDEADPNSYNEKMPAFSLLWSGIVQLGGLDALVHIQAFLPFVTALTVLPGYLLGVKMTRHRGVGLAAGLFLAVFGSFLFLTSSVMKESIGLLVLPVAVLLFYERADPRKRALAFVLLLLLPFLHHLTILMALGMVTALVVGQAMRDARRGRIAWRRVALDILTGPAAAIPALAYYSVVRLSPLEEVTSPDDVALILALTVFLTAIGAGLPRMARVRLGRPLVSPVSHVLLVPALVFGGLLANAASSVFAGTVGTQEAFVALVVPAGAILSAFVFVGYQLLRRTSNRGNDLVLAFLVAPAGLICYAFLRGLDPLSLALVYRSFDFMDFALAILAGVALAFAWSRVRSVALRAGLVATFLAALLATTPMAWNGQAVFGVENVTTPDEFGALAVLASLGARNVTTDQRLADVAESWFGIPGDASLPFKLRDGDDVRGPEYAVLLERWTTVGAQVHPAPNVVIERDAFDRFVERNQVVYALGPLGDRVFVVRLTAEP